MCEPATLTAIATTVASAATSSTFAAVSTAAATAGAAVSTYATVQSGRARASMARYNAKVQEIKANDARYRGQVAETQQRLAAGQQESRARVAMAANGVDITSGSPLDVLTGQAMLNEVDAQIIRANTEREIQGFEQAAVDLRNQASIEDRSATLAAYGGVAKTLSTGFEGASRYRQLKGPKSNKPITGRAASSYDAAKRARLYGGG